MAFSHILLLRINQIMFGRCFSQKKHCTGTTYFYQFKCFTEKCFMKFTPRPRSSLLFSQVYVQTEKKRNRSTLKMHTILAWTKEFLCCRAVFPIYILSNTWMFKKTGERGEAIPPNPSQPGLAVWGTKLRFLNGSCIVFLVEWREVEELLFLIRILHKCQ